MINGGNVFEKSKEFIGVSSISNLAASVMIGYSARQHLIVFYEWINNVSRSIYILMLCQVDVIWRLTTVIAQLIIMSIHIPQTHYKDIYAETREYLKGNTFHVLNMYNKVKTKSAKEGNSINLGFLGLS